MLVVASLLTWDVWTWDDTLPAGEGVGTVLHDDQGHPTGEITGWTDQGYVVQPIVVAPVEKTSYALAAPIVRRFRSIDVQVTDAGDHLVATVVPAPIDVEKLGLLHTEEGEPTVEGAPPDAPADTVTTEALAPFPVTVDLHDRAIVATQVALPDGAFPVVAGARVHVRDGSGSGSGSGTGIVVATLGDDVTVRMDEKKVEPDLRLPNPDDRRVPLWGVLAGVGAVVAAIVGGVAIRGRRK